MSEIEVRELEEQATAVIRACVGGDEIGAWFARPARFHGHDLASGCLRDDRTRLRRDRRLAEQRRP